MLMTMVNGMTLAMAIAMVIAKVIATPTTIPIMLFTMMIAIGITVSVRFATATNTMYTTPLLTWAVRSLCPQAPQPQTQGCLCLHVPSVGQSFTIHSRGFTCSPKIRMEPFTLGSSHMYVF